MTTVIQWLSNFQNIHQYCQSSCPSSPSSSAVGSGKFLYLALSWAIFCSAERSRFAFSFKVYGRKRRHGIFDNSGNSKHFITRIINSLYYLSHTLNKRSQLLHKLVSIMTDSPISFFNSPHLWMSYCKFTIFIMKRLCVSLVQRCNNSGRANMVIPLSSSTHILSSDSTLTTVPFHEVPSRATLSPSLYNILPSCIIST